MNETKQTRRVAAARAGSYEAAVVQPAVRQLFDLLEIPALLEETRVRLGREPRVLLKPNLLMKRRPEEATTTHPAVLSAVIACLRECGVEDVLVADSPGGPYTKVYLNAIYEASGLRAAVRDAGGKVRLNLDCGSCEQRNDAGVQMKSFTLISALEQADFLINLPKCKTHGMMTLSGGVKNLFGLVPGLMKPELHWRFPETDRFAGMLLDLAQLAAPGLTLCDGIVAMEGDGPSGGTPRPLGALLAARSPYNLDAVLCWLLGLPPASVPTVRLGQERELGVSFEELELVGDELSPVLDFRPPKSSSVDFTTRLPGFLQPAADRLLQSRPVIRTKKCIGCGKCAESCPAKTIRIENRKAAILSKNCIKCFCCHEMCPVRAIDIKRFRLFDL